MATLSLSSKHKTNTNSGLGGKILRYNDFWGCEDEKTLSVAIPANATWGDVYILALDLIDSADDKHHTFIEEIEQDSIDTSIVWVYTGS